VSVALEYATDGSNPASVLLLGGSLGATMAMTGFPAPASS
jgi:hypothetical protein